MIRVTVSRGIETWLVFQKAEENVESRSKAKKTERM